MSEQSKTLVQFVELLLKRHDVYEESSRAILSDLEQQFGRAGFPGDISQLETELARVKQECDKWREMTEMALEALKSELHTEPQWQRHHALLKQFNALNQKGSE